MGHPRLTPLSWGRRNWRRQRPQRPYARYRPAAGRDQKPTHTPPSLPRAVVAGATVTQGEHSLLRRSAARVFACGTETCRGPRPPHTAPRRLPEKHTYCGPPAPRWGRSVADCNHRGPTIVSPPEMVARQAPPTRLSPHGAAPPRHNTGGSSAPLRPQPPSPSAPQAA
ncbi:uncharacterized protein Tco025E_06205 [Trypanosoma conorhini]|uniref:Uncharacterized protein n=1 Tax=Trypanosoma conorhini TaxID=83891 RepID=A0A422P6R2_9TRYP|nr:uncharacterized protein Tco025E_06205 [Trypanosoma conorhini]RNF13407.1 hypothetical protein Tco025E_06205 [Trypanosoma conorhini]